MLAVKGRILKAWQVDVTPVEPMLWKWHISEAGLEVACGYAASRETARIDGVMLGSQCSCMILGAPCNPAGRLTLSRRLCEFLIDAARASLGQGVVHLRGRNAFHDVADEVFSGVDAACLEPGHGAVRGCELRDAQGD